MIWQTYLTSQFQLNWYTEEQNTTHKPVTWWDHIRAPAYVQIAVLDAGRVTPELKLRLKFLNLVFFYCIYCLFVILLWVFNFYFHSCFLCFCTINLTITIFSSLFSPLHSPSLSCVTTYFNTTTSQLLFQLLLIHSLPLPSPLHPILPQPVTTLPFLPTYLPPADQPTIPTLHNPNIL
jgi:hypothetical protein